MWIYAISSYIGYFLFLIICLALAIVFHKKKIALPVYFIGAIVTLISLIGKQKSFIGLDDTLKSVVNRAMITHWVIYVLLLVIAGSILVFKRIKNHKSNSQVKRCKRCHTLVHISAVSCNCGSTEFTEFR